MDYSQYIVPALVVIVGIILYVKIHSQGKPTVVLPPAPPPTVTFSTALPPSTEGGDRHGERTPKEGG